MFVCRSADAMKYRCDSQENAVCSSFRFRTTRRDPEKKVGKAGNKDGNVLFWGKESSSLKLLPESERINCNFFFSASLVLPDFLLSGNYDERALPKAK